MFRSSAIWQNGSTLITHPDKASKRRFETRSSRKSGARLSGSIKESRSPALRRDDHLRRPETLAPRSDRGDFPGTLPATSQDRQPLAEPTCRRPAPAHSPGPASDHVAGRQAQLDHVSAKKEYNGNSVLADLAANAAGELPTAAITSTGRDT